MTTVTPRQSLQTSLTLAAIAAAGLLMVAALATTAPPAAAHSASTFYPNRWLVGRDVLSFRFNKTIPKGRWRTRINQGAQEWTRHNRRVYFVSADANRSNRLAPSLKCPTNDPAPSIVFRLELKGKAIGTNQNCIDRDGELLYFRQGYDSTFKDWWTDPNSSGKIPRNKIDLRSVVAHEMGHATGFAGHFDDDGPDSGSKKDFKSYCRSWNAQDKADDVYKPTANDTPYTARQTMCFATARGQTGQRKLGAHDRGTFRNAYPAR